MRENPESITSVLAITDERNDRAYGFRDRAKRRVLE